MKLQSFEDLRLYVELWNFKEAWLDPGPRPEPEPVQLDLFRYVHWNGRQYDRATGDPI